MGKGKSRSNEAELAALLEEVRELRRKIEGLETNPAVARAVTQPAYEVLVKAQRGLPPDYQVAVTPTKLPPGYEVAVKALAPDTPVLARPAYPPDYQVAVRTLPALPPDYEVAVKAIVPEGFDAAKLPPDYAVAVKAFHPDQTLMARVAYPPSYAVAARTLPTLPPNYEVAVRGPFKSLEEPITKKAGAKKAGARKRAKKK
jgi:hypothetical protein